MTDWSLYVHVPACRLRCPYCAFYVVPEHELPAERFVDRVLEEHDRRRLPGAPATVYLGGGTPTRLPRPALLRLLRGVVPASAREVTVEANPEDVDANLLTELRDVGVDRVSLGVQTLDAGRARRLSRVASCRHARRAAALLGESGIRTWSADLMFGLPDQSLHDLVADLDALLALDPPHVSVYGLTVEEGTPFERARAREALPLPDDDAWRAMYDHLVQRLTAAGLHRYEVSNFARPGHASLHNQGYWEDRPYVGIGPSAHGMLPDGARQIDVPDLSTWLQGGQVTETEVPTPHQRALDRVISGLRGVDGLPLRHLEEVGFTPNLTRLRSLVEGGLLVLSEGRIKLGHEGFYVADAVTRRVADALVPALAGPARTR